MTDKRLILCCLVDGKSTSFPVEIESAKTIGELKKAIKAEKANELRNVDAETLTLWKVSVPVLPKKDRKEVSLSDVSSKEELVETDDVSDVFAIPPPKKTIHIIVQRPPPAVQTPVHARAPSPFAGHLLKSSRHVSPNIEDIKVEIERIISEFFSPGTPAATLLTRFIQDRQQLPLTTGRIRGLPRVWLRGDEKPSDTRPNLLFFDLPDPTIGTISPKQLTSDAILDLVDNSGYEMATVFGVSGCGKTRGLIEALSRRWGFYFNASKDDIGSADLSTLVLTIESHLKNDDQFANNRCARQMTYLLFIARLSVLQFCLEVPDIDHSTFSSARWTILQACPHIFKVPGVNGDVFDDLFQRLLMTQWRTTSENVLVGYLREKLDRTTALLKQRNGIQFSNQLLVIHDEAQVLGEKYGGLFQSRASDDDRPLLSPILHAFRMISRTHLFQIISGTELSVYTHDMVLSAGAACKQLSTGRHYLEFPGWTDRQSVEAYVACLRRSLMDEGARQYLDTLLPPKAIETMIETLLGRFRPIVSCLEETIGMGMPDGWKKAIVDTEARLISLIFDYVPGNLQYGLRRLESEYSDKFSHLCDKFSHLSDLQSVEEILGLLLYQRYMFGDSELVLPVFFTLLVEIAFGRIKMIDGKPRVVVDEPFVLKAAETYFTAKDSSFMKALRDWEFRNDRPQDHGCAWELMMASVLPETFKLHPLFKWPHIPSILSLSRNLKGSTEVVGLDERSFERGITYRCISMEEFMDAHANNNSLRDDGRPVPPFFFPLAKLSGPDIIFFLQIENKIILDKKCIVPVFMQLKHRQVTSTSKYLDALESVSTNTVKEHVKNFHDYCPANVYIILIVSYPVRLTALSPRPDLELETLKERLASHHPRPSKNPPGNDDLTEVVIRVDKTNFEAIFPKSHVEFVEGIKTPAK